MAYGIQFPDQRSNQGSLHWEHGVLTTGPPEKSHLSFYVRVRLLQTFHCPDQPPNLNLTSYVAFFWSVSHYPADSYVVKLEIDKSIIKIQIMTHTLNLSVSLPNPNPKRIFALMISSVFSALNAILFQSPS